MGAGGPAHNQRQTTGRSALVGCTGPAHDDQRTAEPTPLNPKTHARVKRWMRSYYLQHCSRRSYDELSIQSSTFLRPTSFLIVAVSNRDTVGLDTLDPLLVASPIDSPINSPGAGAGADVLSRSILSATTVSSTPVVLPLNLPIPLPELVSTRPTIGEMLARVA
ncbi:hypothetical protein LWI29_035230 [Acer saccharum]|uniref:Uncharacterized protein n=1 Tax=Acer saccharum TaxID=4024 RepID=A0AA39VL35_ACESA|nr:hypothetical protein LWI29_035230 [Acer saccharum]